MESKQLQKLKRSELLGMLLQRSKELDRVKAELDAERAAHTETREMLDSQKIAIEESGSIAEATVRISGIMEEAQAAADEYLKRVREQAEEETASLKIAKSALAKKQELLDALQSKLDEEILQLNKEKKELEAARERLEEQRIALEADRAALVKERDALKAEQAPIASEGEMPEADREAMTAGEDSEKLSEEQDPAEAEQDAEA